MKKIFCFIFFLFYLIRSEAQIVETQETLTDGIEYWDYSDRQLFEFLRVKFWKEWAEKTEFDLGEALTDKVLLVRLVSNDRKIAALRKRGKTASADRLAEEDKKINSDIIDGMIDYYKKGEYYFYYPKDARSIFVEENFSFLMLDEKNPIENLPNLDQAYVLKYIDIGTRAVKEYHSYYWGITDKKMIRIKKYSFMPRTGISPKPDHYKAIKHYCQKKLR